MLSPLSTTSNARQDKVFRKPPQLTPEQRDAILHEPSGQASYDESDDDDNNPYKPAYHHRKAPASRTAKLRVQDRQSQSSPKSSPKKRRSKHSSSDIQRFGASDAITQGRKRKAPGKELDYNATTRRHDAINQKFLAAGEVIDIAKADFNRACQVFGGRAVQSKKDDEDGDLKWHVRGMSERSYLPDHELLGAAFMRKREFASTAPSGGILADEMGLVCLFSCPSSIGITNSGRAKLFSSSSTFLAPTFTMARKA